MATSSRSAWRPRSAPGETTTRWCACSSPSWGASPMGRPPRARSPSSPTSCPTVWAGRSERFPSACGRSPWIPDRTQATKRPWRSLVRWARCAVTSTRPAALVAPAISAGDVPLACTLLARLGRRGRERPGRRPAGRGPLRAGGGAGTAIVRAAASARRRLRAPGRLRPASARALAVRRGADPGGRAERGFATRSIVWQRSGWRRASRSTRARRCCEPRWTRTPSTIGPSRLCAAPWRSTPRTGRSSISTSASAASPGTSVRSSTR